MTRFSFFLLAAAIAVVPLLTGCNSVEGDSVAPLVSINNPGDRTTVTGPIPVEAAASDNGAVTRVDFLLDGAVLSQATQQPWQIEWDASGASEGVHVLQARAFDDAGNQGTSGPVAVNVCLSTAAFEAGPIWNQADAGTKCPTTCQGVSKSWTGQWWTTVPGQMSVCQCTCPNPF